MEKDMFSLAYEEKLRELKKMLLSPTVNEFIHNIGLAFVNLAESKILSLSIFIGATYVIIDTLKSVNDKAYEYIEQEIKLSDYYKECSQRYDEYLSVIANTFKATKLTTPLEYSILYTELLHQGYFSITDIHTYKKECYDDYDMPQLAGTRILEGNSVCRHVSIFLGNLLDKLNIESYQQYCRTRTLGTVKLEDLLHQNESNHLITAIVENNEKFFVDPLNKTNPIITMSSKRTDFSFESLLFPYQEGIGLYDFSNDIYSFQVFNEPSKNEEIQNIPLEFIKKEELNELKDYIQKTIISNIDILEESKQEQIENMKRIVELENILMPHGDSEPKKWVLK